MNVYKAHDAERHAKIRERAYDGYGGKCACCGSTNRRTFQLDHVDGGGCEFRKASGHRSGTSTYYWAIRNNFPPDLQILCSNCHHIKSWYGGCTEDDHLSFSPQRET